MRSMWSSSIFSVMNFRTLQHSSHCNLYRDVCNIYMHYKEMISPMWITHNYYRFSPATLFSRRESGKSIPSEEYFRLTAKLRTTEACSYLGIYLSQQRLWFVVFKKVEKNKSKFEWYIKVDVLENWYVITYVHKP